MLLQDCVEDPVLVQMDVLPPCWAVLHGLVLLRVWIRKWGLLKSFGQVQLFDPLFISNFLYKCIQKFVGECLSMKTSQTLIFVQFSKLIISLHICCVKLLNWIYLDICSCWNSGLNHNYINVFESHFSMNVEVGLFKYVHTPPPQTLLQLLQDPQLAQEACTAENDDWSKIEINH